MKQKQLVPVCGLNSKNLEINRFQGFALVFFDPVLRPFSISLSTGSSESFCQGINHDRGFVNHFSVYKPLPVPYFWRSDNTLLLTPVAD